MRSKAFLLVVLSTTVSFWNLFDDTYTEILRRLAGYSDTANKEVCPEYDIPNLVSERKVNMSVVSIDEVELMLLGDRQEDIKRLDLEKTNETSSFVFEARSTHKDRCSSDHLRKDLQSSSLRTKDYTYTIGGIWKPNDCLPRWKVAIIIPFRNRLFHLPILLRYLTPMLQRQRLEFGFYVIEQANDLLFNKAMLMNIGFLESLNFSKWDCFVFHDVDHIPLSDYNYYGCSGMPKLFFSGADRWEHWKLPSEHFFGAVTGLVRSQMYQINGFPNVYWGWGGEDNEIGARIKEVGLEITRVKGKTGHYNVIKHNHQSAPECKERYRLLDTFRLRMKKDGLSSLQYKKPVITFHALYTNISVDIQKIKVDIGLKELIQSFANITTLTNDFLGLVSSVYSVA